MYQPFNYTQSLLKFQGQHNLVFHTSKNSFCHYSQILQAQNPLVLIHWIFHPLKPSFLV